MPKLVELEPGDLGKPGQWQHTRDEGRATARVSCPGCGREASLASHDINARGCVSPSMVCPWACGFHAFVVLRGWDQPKGGG